MLIREVTSAEDQLNLLKRIIDSTWSAISAEAAQEKAAKQQRAAAAAAKPEPRKRPRIQTKRGAAKAITPKSTTPPQAQSAATPTSSQQPTQPNQAAATNTTQEPQTRRVYPSPKPTPTEVPTETIPIARLGKVATVPSNQ